MTRLTKRLRKRRPDNGSVKEFYNSKRIPSTDSFNEVENDGRYE